MVQSIIAQTLQDFQAEAAGQADEKQKSALVESMNSWNCLIIVMVYLCNVFCFASRNWRARGHFLAQKEKALLLPYYCYYYQLISTSTITVVAYVCYVFLLTPRAPLRPISVLKLWISEGLRIMSTMSGCFQPSQQRGHSNETDPPRVSADFASRRNVAAHSLTQAQI